jgi:hypothetical protein
MSYKDHIIRSIAKNRCKLLSVKVIHELKEMTGETLSGNDSPLENVWEEICVQAQHEESFRWEAYLETILQIINAELPCIDAAIKQAIWLQTDEGFEWSHNCEDEEENDIYYDEEGIAYYIMNEFILSEAGKYTNNHIERYLHGEAESLEEFELIDDDFSVINIATTIARRFLTDPQIKPSEIIGLGNALYALERLPLVTPGSNTDFGIEYRTESDSFNEMCYVHFLISEDTFHVSTGGSVYDEAVGGDTFSGPEWLVEIGGHRSTDHDIWDVEASVVEYLNLGAKLIINDESQIEYK